MRPTPCDKGLTHAHFLTFGITYLHFSLPKSFVSISESNRQSSLPPESDSLTQLTCLMPGSVSFKAGGCGRTEAEQQREAVSRRRDIHNPAQGKCHSVPSLVRATGKVTDFPDDLQEGTESNVFAAPADSRIK